MNKKKSIFSTIIISLLLLITSIFISSEYGLVSAATKTSTVTINTTSAFLVKGEAINLKITGTSKKVTWASTNKSIAIVTSTGKVTAVRYGTAYVKATVNNQTYKSKITVIDPAEITFKPTDIMVIVDGTGVNLNPESDIYSAAVLKKAGLTYKVSGNSGVKVSSTGKVTATKEGEFKIVASVRGKKIETIAMKAVKFEGFSVQEIVLEKGIEEFVSFADDIKLLYKNVKVSISNSSLATAESNFIIDLYSDITLCDGIYMVGLKDGTCTISVTISGVTKDIKVIIGDGLEKLDPIEAVRSNNLSGYTGTPLKLLSAIRRFIDDNNLLSDSLSDREKITIIQNYLNDTYTGKEHDYQYEGLLTSVFLGGSGVCASYTETFCFLCECIGIEVYYCIGTADNRKIIGAHSWNKVKADGVWYYIDTYWNAGLGSFKYFLTETLWSDHWLREEGTFIEIWNATYPAITFY